MKKNFTVLVGLTALVVFGSTGIYTGARNEFATPVRSDLVSPNLVISQFQTGGAASAFNDEFVEIHNIGPVSVDLSGHRVVYRSATGVNDVGPFAAWASSTIIPSGGYYLIASTAYDGTAIPDMTYNPASCSCSMSGTGGGLAIRQGDQNSGLIIDSVGWGTATNIFVEGTATGAPAVENSQSRKSSGCQDSDNNLNDFEATIPAVAHSSAGSPSVCSGGGTTLFAAINANPTTVSPLGRTLLAVTVIPATTPPSTGITVVGNLAQIGLSSSQTFFDDGTNGDVTPSDNVFSYSAVIPGGTAGGVYSVTAVASDAEARTVNLTQFLTVSGPQPNDDPLLFGNPSNATGDIANENNYLMQKTQYSLSYSRANATPNWVAWRLDSSWIGTAQRQDDYRPDPALPAAWYHVQDNDYSGSGYDRGHMCPSGDRTRSIPDNSATFLMTNFVPQLGANNQGPWNDLEIYLRTLASQGNEIYIFSGPQGNIGTISQGRIVVPKFTWKVVLILPNGGSDLQRVSRATRVFGVIVPNQPPISNSGWRTYRVTVNAVEYLTGFDFFSAIPKNTQELIERKRDKQ